MELLKELDRTGEKVVLSIEKLKDLIEQKSRLYKSWGLRNIYNTDTLISMREKILRYYRNVVSNLIRYQKCLEKINRSAAISIDRKADITGQGKDNIHHWLDELPERKSLMIKLPWLHDGIVYDLQKEHPAGFSRIDLLNLGLAVKSGSIEKLDKPYRQYEVTSFEDQFKTLNDRISRFNQAKDLMSEDSFPLILNVSDPYRNAKKIGNMLAKKGLIGTHDIIKFAKLLSGQEVQTHILWHGGKESEFHNFMKEVIQPHTIIKDKNTPWKAIKAKFKKLQPGSKSQPIEFGENLKSNTGSYTSVLHEIEDLLTSL